MRDEKVREKTYRITIPLWPIVAALVVLKLTGCVAWPWWAVTSPLWVPVVVAAALFLLASLLTILVHLMDAE